jgi:hypothetical protein
MRGGISMKTVWSLNRLQRLFDRYNKRFWGNSIRGFTVSIKALSGPNGICEVFEREICIDIDSHSSDREVRATLLHEMAHASAGPRGIGHGYKFWEQMEMLLEKRAPIVLTEAEAPESRTFADVIPKRFPLAREAVKRLELARVRGFKKAPRFDRAATITEEKIIGDFEEAAVLFSPRTLWRTVLQAVDEEHGLLDVGGRPRSAWQAHVISKGKEAFHRKRRFWSRQGLWRRID